MLDALTMLRPTLLALLTALCLAACDGAAADLTDRGGGKADDLEGECLEPCGFDETMLLAAADGRLVLQSIGGQPVRTEVAVESEGRFIFATSRGGRFVALFSDGVVAAIDGHSGELVSRTVTSGAQPFAVEMRSRSEAFVSFAGSPVIQRIDLEGGAVLDSIDVSSGIADLTARHMRVVGGELFVAGALGERTAPRGSQLAVIDLASDQIARTAELIWRDPDTGEVVPAFNPTLPLVLDPPFDRNLGLGPLALRFIARLDGDECHDSHG